MTVMHRLLGSDVVTAWSRCAELLQNYHICQANDSSTEESRISMLDDPERKHMEHELVRQTAERSEPLPLEISKNLPWSPIAPAGRKRIGSILLILLLNAFVSFVTIQWTIWRYQPHTTAPESSRDDMFYCTVIEAHATCLTTANGLLAPATEAIEDVVRVFNKLPDPKYFGEPTEERNRAWDEICGGKMSSKVHSSPLTLRNI